MTGTGRLHEVRALLEALEGLTPSEQSVLLDERCADDPQLRSEAEAMLAEMSRADDGFLTPPVPGLASKAFDSVAEASDIPEDAFPGYQVLRVVGEGGMGVVYEAEQAHPKRRVALKVVRASLPTRELMRRFRLETEVLGRLQHPGIAQIYEAGTQGKGKSERPFFAMEFVEGASLTEYAEAQGLDIRERVRMLIEICEAVEHAHQKGVIHRDLKPSNILVGRAGRPKILDFGVARSTDAEAQVTTMGTTSGQVVGTLAYMSPEQLKGDPGGLDTRSDVFALGVVAYELFAGRLPHDLTDMSLPEAIRSVGEDEPATLGGLRRELRGDLSTIVAKAMERDRERRYQSPSMLAADLGRYLSSEPIVARPPTAAYRLRKFTSRNPALVGGLLGVFLVLVLGIIATSVTAAWALDAEAEARENAEAAGRNAEEATANAVQAAREAAIADAINTFLNDDLLAAVDPENNADREITMREVLDIAAERIEGRFEDQPLIEARIRLTLGKTYQNLGLLEEAERHSRIGVALLRAHNEPGAIETLAYANSLAATLLHRGLYAEAAELLEPLVAERRAKEGIRDEMFLVSATNLASAYMRLGRLAEAEPLVLDALAGKRATLGDTHQRTLTSVSLASNLYTMLGEIERAHEYVAEAYESRLATLGEKHPSTLLSMTTYAYSLSRMDRCDEARTVLERCREVSREVLGSDHPQYVAVINAQTMNETKAGRHEEAIGYAREALAKVVKSLGSDHPQVPTYHFNLARALAGAGRYDEAIPVYERVVEMERETLPADHYLRASTLHEFAGALFESGYSDAAEAAAREALCIFANSLGIRDERTQSAMERYRSISETRMQSPNEAGRETESAEILVKRVCGEG